MGHAVTRNAVHCLTCDTTIESVHRHDFKWCNCPTDGETMVAVDGGTAYSRRCWGVKAKWRELTDLDPSQSMSVVNATPEKDRTPAALPGLRVDDYD